MGFLLNFCGDLFPAPFVVANRPRVTIAADSIGNDERAEASVAGSFNDEMKLYFDSVTAGGTQDMSSDGMYMLKSTAVAAGGTIWMINDDSGSDPAGWVRGAEYSTLLAALSSGPETSDIWELYSGINDANASGGITKTKQKNAYIKLEEFIREDFPNVQYILLHIIHRQFGGSPSDANFQIVREAQLETCAERAFYYEAPSTIDLDLVDTVHFLQAEHQTNIPERYARRHAAICRKVSGSALGPEITAAVWNTDHAVLTLTHAEGTDITVDSGAGVMLGYDIDGTVITGSGATRTNATTIKVDFDNTGFVTPDSDDYLKFQYGAMTTLAQTSPATIIDNATIPLPVRPKVILPTIADPLLLMTPTIDISAKAGVRTLSGSDVTDITGRSAIGLNSSAGRYPTYETTNNGALVVPDTTTSMRSDAAFTAASTGYFLTLCWDMPASIPFNNYIWGLGTSTTVQSSGRASLFLNSSTGLLQYGQNQAAGFENIVSDCRGKKAVIIINYTSASSCTIHYYSNGENVTIGPFDPHDSPTTQTYMWLFGGTHSVTTSTTNFKLHRAFFRNTPYNSGSDPSITSIASFLNTQHGVGATIS